jgi:hypothetical protein
LTATQDVALATLATLVDVKVTRVLALAGAGRDRPQRRAAEEGHFDVVRGLEPDGPGQMALAETVRLEVIVQASIPAERCALPPA